jgi:Ni/Co efflux regulator RcnB
MQHNARQRILLGLVTVGMFADTDSAEQAKQEQLAKEAAKAQKQEVLDKKKHHQQPKHVKSHEPVHKHRQTAQRLKRY